MEAGRRLGIRIQAPYETDGQTFLAFLPDFGGPHGMLVAALGSTTEQPSGAPKPHGHYVSFVSDTYATFAPDLFRDTLDDWGWFGPDGIAPEWYSGAAWGG